MLAVPARSKLSLSYIAAASPIRINAWTMLRALKGGRIFFDFLPTITSFTANRTRISAPRGELITADAEILGAVIDGATALKRGQFYAELEYQTGNRFSEVCRGYQYNGFAPSFRDRIESGPGGGEGHRAWSQVANDVAGNVDTTIALAATGAIRRVDAILVKYHASSDVATRGMLIQLRDIADTSGPTGFSINADGWRTPSISMTQNEEGLIYVKEGNLVTNDNGSVTRDDSAQGNPFPFWVMEGDTTKLLVDISSGEAADDYDTWVLMEEWLVL